MKQKTATVTLLVIGLLLMIGSFVVGWFAFP